MNRQRNRAQPCSAADARKRLGDAVRFLEVARLTADEYDPDVAYSSVSASLAVLAGIAAADAACCKSLGERSRAQNHHDAEKLVESIAPGGRQAAKALKALIKLKDAAQYGLVDVEPAQLKRAIRGAAELVSFADRIVRA